MLLRKLDIYIEKTETRSMSCILKVPIQSKPTIIRLGTTVGKSREYTGTHRHRQ
jgi:hypothetical protein